MEGFMKAHPFERTLGPGPYRLVGSFAIVIIESQGRNNLHMAPQVERGMGSCAHCGQGILNVYIVACADGKRYGVGSDCIHKAGMPANELTKLERMEREHQRKLRADRKERKHQAAKEEILHLLSAHKTYLANQPHPSTRNGSFLDYANWVVARSRNCVYLLKTIKLELVKGQA